MKRKLVLLVFLLFIAMLGALISWGFYKGRLLYNYNLVENTAPQIPVEDSLGQLKSIVAQQLFDRDSVLLHDFSRYGSKKLGVQYQPLLISQFILTLSEYSNYDLAKAYMRANIKHFRRKSEGIPDSVLLFPYNFDFPNHNEKAPWYSAMTQASVAKSFIAAGKVLNDTTLEQYAKMAIRPLMADRQNIFIDTLSTDSYWLNEYPSWKYEVLDGTLSSLADLMYIHENITSSGFKATLGTFIERCKNGILVRLPGFLNAYTGHYYASNGLYPTASYYWVNVHLIRSLASKDARFEPFVQKFSMSETSRFKSVMVYYHNKYIELFHM